MLCEWSTIKEKRNAGESRYPRVREGRCYQEDPWKVGLRWAVTIEQQSQEQISGDAGRWVVCRAVFLKKKKSRHLGGNESWDSPRKHKLVVLIPTSHIAMWPARTALHGKCQQRTHQGHFPVLYLFPSAKTSQCTHWNPLWLDNTSVHFALSQFSCKAAKRFQPFLRSQANGSDCFQPFS